MTAGPASARQVGAPRVSVVIATYDRPLNLSMAIESVLRQSDQNWEIVVIGDHCNPETAEVLAGFGDAGNSRCRTRSEWPSREARSSRF